MKEKKIPYNDVSMKYNPVNAGGEGWQESQRTGVRVTEFMNGPLRNRITLDRKMNTRTPRALTGYVYARVDTRTHTHVRARSHATGNVYVHSHPLEARMSA